MAAASITGLTLVVVYSGVADERLKLHSLRRNKLDWEAYRE